MEVRVVRWPRKDCPMPDSCQKCSSGNWLTQSLPGMGRPAIWGSRGETGSKNLESVDGNLCLGFFVT